MATMSYTLGMAARATGTSKSSIYRAIKAGRISAGRTDTGAWAIDPTELHRVFPPVDVDASHSSKHSVTPYVTSSQCRQIDDVVRIARLQAAHDASAIIIDLL